METFGHGPRGNNAATGQEEAVPGTGQEETVAATGQERHQCGQKEGRAVTHPEQEGTANGLTHIGAYAVRFNREEFIGGNAAHLNMEVRKLWISPNTSPGLSPSPSLSLSPSPKP